MFQAQTDVKPQLGFDAPVLRDDEFQSLRDLIRNTTGISLSSMKRDLLRTRLRKRLVALGLATYREYYQLLRGRPVSDPEMVEMINCITTNKTDFFRESHHFEFLQTVAFPQFAQAARSTGKRKLRIWSAGCSTGQEPYSIACYADQFFGNLPGWDTRILASDIDSNCLNAAAGGIYDDDRVLDVPVELKKKYFLRGTGQMAGKVSVRPALRDMITFRRINLADRPWPINITFDVIFCRNVMIYFDRDFQQTLLENFQKVLAPDGYLILGHSENVSWMNSLQPIGRTVYRPVVPSGVQRSTTRQPVRPAVTTHPMWEEPRATHAVPDKQRRAIVAGEVFASNRSMQITTLLGSCVAACLYDPVAKAGGMNHFLLPEGKQKNDSTACYGIHAMELLINEIMKLGGDRSRMIAKVYGGANVLPGRLDFSRVGKKNVAFVSEYLATEGIPIVESKVGGQRAVRVAMDAQTGVVNVTTLRSNSDSEQSRVDSAFLDKTTLQATDQEAEKITFFD